MNDSVSSPEISNFAAMTSDIVSSYVARNAVGISDLPALIQSVHKALATVDEAAAPPATERAKVTPAQIRKSITPEALISFEDGKSYKTLKRHLAARGLSGQAYKDKWGLPSDYPLTAPAYSARRSELAKSRELGKGGRGKAKSGKAAKATAAK